MHPTMKPVALVADAMRDCSRRGDIVLDLFMGSGTTIMAAERVGRRACGLEIDARYVDVAVRRWQALHVGATPCSGTPARASRRSAAAREQDGGRAMNRVGCRKTGAPPKRPARRSSDATHSVGYGKPPTRASIPTGPVGQSKGPPKGCEEHCHSAARNSRSQGRDADWRQIRRVSVREAMLTRFAEICAQR